MSLIVVFFITYVVVLLATTLITMAAHYPGKGNPFRTLKDVAPVNAVVLGRSNIVGKPMADLLLQHNCNVTTLHSKTSEADRLFALSHADLIISATGQRGIIKGSDIKQGAIVVDVGIIRGADGKLYGDVDYESVSPKASFITPVPGGVGPMTRAMLIRNVAEAAFQYGW